MKLLLAFIIINFIQGTAYCIEVEKKDCIKYTLGTQPIRLDDRELILSVSKAELLDDSDDSFALAVEAARLDAKSKLANYKKNSNLQGVREIYNCKSGSFIYVGLVEKDEKNAKHLLNKINESIKTIPTIK
jgi:hypothetical protein